MHENLETTAAVIGYPIKHSRSPLIHNDWLARTGSPGHYDILEIAPDELGDACAQLRESAMKGFNVTIPHKEAIIPYLDEIDETAQKIGAVNTVSIRDGKLFGTNTDAYGFLENLHQGVPCFKVDSGPAVVLGAGGAARAVIYALQQEGVPQIILTNRTRSKAETLATDFKNIEVVDWEHRTGILSKANMLVNTTSLGMVGQPELDLDLFALSTRAVVYDLVYNPLQTELLKHAASKGCPALGGLGMLVYQAEKAFEIWFDIKPPVTEELMNKLKESL